MVENTEQVFRRCRKAAQPEAALTPGGCRHCVCPAAAGKPDQRIAARTNDGTDLIAFPLTRSRPWIEKERKVAADRMPESALDRKVIRYAKLMAQRGFNDDQIAESLRPFAAAVQALVGRIRATDFGGAA